MMHQKGVGVRRKNAQKAFQYYTLASHAGHLQVWGTVLVCLCGSYFTYFPQLCPYTALILRAPHYMQAMYNAAMMQLAGRGTTK